jgi:hypothetical protein
MGTVYQHLAIGGNFEEKVNWCKKNLYHGGHYEPKWQVKYPYIWFNDEKEYVLFLLRWA